MYARTSSLAIALLTGPAASADDLQFTFSESSGAHSASANFTFCDDDPGAPTLEIVLTNTMTTSTGPVWLTGLFFDLAGSPELSFSDTSADLVTFEGGTPNDVDGDPASFWAYRDDLAGELPFGDQAYGLGAAGFDVFGRRDMLDTTGNPKPGGVDGGIVPDLDGLAIPNGHQDEVFMNGALTFTFWLPSNFDLDAASVSNVAFAFGSGFDEIVLTPVVPLPAAAPLALAGLGLMLIGRRRAAANR